MQCFSCVSININVSTLRSAWRAYNWRDCALTRVDIQALTGVFSVSQLSVACEVFHRELKSLFLPASELALFVGADKGLHREGVRSGAQRGGRSPPLAHLSHGKSSREWILTAPSTSTRRSVGAHAPRLDKFKKFSSDKNNPNEHLIRTFKDPGYVRGHS